MRPPVFAGPHVCVRSLRMLQQQRVWIREEESHPLLGECASEGVTQQMTQAPARKTT